MRLPENDIAFTVDEGLKASWLDGWGGASRAGRALWMVIAAGIAGAVLLAAAAVATAGLGTAAGGTVPAHQVFLVVGALACLAVSVGALLAIRRQEVSAGKISGERLLIDSEGYLVYVRRDDRELVDTGDSRYFWGKVGQARNVRMSVAYLPECTYRMLDEYRALVIEPRRDGAVRTLRLASERELESSGALRTRLHAGCTPEEFCQGARGEADLAVELCPYFSPDLANVLRELGVPERKDLPL